MDDQPRPAATSPDDYTLSIEDAVALYEHAGLPRTPRTVQRYCGNGHLDCRRVEIPYGEKYLITPASITKHIAYIEETRQTLAGRDEPRPVAPQSQHGISAPTELRPAPTGLDQPRQTAADTEAVSRYAARLEGENTFLREQITVKDVQIKDLTERARETNHLIAGLQKMLTPLLGRPRNDDHDRAYNFSAQPAPENRNGTYADRNRIETGPIDSTGDNSELRP